ncbi:hypothetical protein EU509_01295 [Pseudoalteromonas fuliginea]|uniref:Uncharacterized protein n=1 Tax=Pseudoalteromonas fuliginea TaxID=1872678 RepID=A0ABQ6RN03_9GAMM|nr:hypothetical protein EU509_01295 [Pseudoalteromonas fuliginea]KAA1169566.1 hypothetical protein EUZ79_01405 [Pseudoalteromonas fuliginea]
MGDAFGLTNLHFDVGLISGEATPSDTVKYLANYYQYFMLSSRWRVLTADIGNASLYAECTYLKALIASLSCTSFPVSILVTLINTNS